MTGKECPGRERRREDRLQDVRGGDAERTSGIERQEDDAIPELGAWKAWMFPRRRHPGECDSPEESQCSVKCIEEDSVSLKRQNRKGSGPEAWQAAPGLRLASRKRSPISLSATVN